MHLRFISCVCWQSWYTSSYSYNNQWNSWEIIVKGEKHKAETKLFECCHGHLLFTYPKSIAMLEIQQDFHLEEWEDALFKMQNIIYCKWDTANVS